MKERLLRYWLGANAAGLQGGALAVKAFVGGATANAVVGSIPPLTLEQAACVFAVAFLYDFCGWLGAHPFIVEPEPKPEPAAPILPPQI